MQHQFSQMTQRVLSILVLVLIACAIGLAAGRNSTSVPSTPQSRAASYSAFAP